MSRFGPEHMLAAATGVFAGQLGFVVAGSADWALGLLAAVGVGAALLRFPRAAVGVTEQGSQISTASYVQHELRNTLTAASLHAEMLGESGGPGGEPRSDNLAAIREALHHALTLSERLSGDPVRSHPFVSEAAGTLERCARLVEPVIRKSGALETELPQSLGAVGLDEAEFSELTINLLVNANEAIAEGGTVRLSATKLEDPERVAFEVADDGCGMEEQLVRRIFRVGVSAKRGGTGLGLARVRQILTKCAGIIEVRSALGSGTIVRVEIPTAAISTGA